MSNNSARRPQPASNGAQLSRASSASSRDEITPMSRPVSLFTRARKARPFAARRHASVAMARKLGFVRIGSHVDEEDGYEDILALG